MICALSMLFYIIESLIRAADQIVELRPAFVQRYADAAMDRNVFAEFRQREMQPRGQLVQYAAKFVNVFQAGQQHDKFIAAVAPGQPVKFLFIFTQYIADILEGEVSGSMSVSIVKFFQIVQVYKTESRDIFAADKVFQT